MFRLSVDTIVGFSDAFNILILISVVSSGISELVKETLCQVSDKGTSAVISVLDPSEPILYIAKTNGWEFNISKDTFSGDSL